MYSTCIIYTGRRNQFCKRYQILFKVYDPDSSASCGLETWVLFETDVELYACQLSGGFAKSQHDPSPFPEISLGERGFTLKACADRACNFIKYNNS